MNRVITFGKTEKGMREVNQDCYSHFNLRNVECVILCDGNGGPGAETLSKEIVQMGIGLTSYALFKAGKIQFEFLKGLGLDVIRRCAEHARMLKAADSSLGTCGTTITVVFAHESKILVFWVGDSPAYAVKGGELIRLTHPLHTLKEYLISKGVSKEEISQQDGLSSILTRCLGHSECEPDFKVFELKPPYVLIASSDGIACLPEKRLLEIVSGSHPRANLPCRIIRESLDMGSDDNITLVSAHVTKRLKIRVRLRKRRAR